MIFLPVKPRFAFKIHTGEKLVEFRKVGFKRENSHCVLYASSPTKRIIGYFEFETVAEGSPDEIWVKYGKKGCISREEYMSYFNSRDKAYAIVIKNYYPLEEYIDPKQHVENFQIPQSFRYLSKLEISKFVPSV